MMSGRADDMKPLLTQLVLYDNDAVDASYSDGCRLQVAACGSAFAHHQPAGEDVHPIHGVRTVKQRTAFVTSAFQDAVSEAVDFRNRFAHQPFLCSKLGDFSDIIRLHADVFEVAWPEECSSVLEFPDGSLQVTSMDDYATITLPPHRQTFTAQFLCKVSENMSKTRRPLPPVTRVSSSAYSQQGGSTYHHELSAISHATQNGQIQLTDSINELNFDGRSTAYDGTPLNQSKSSNIGESQDTCQSNQSKYSHVQPLFGINQSERRIQTGQSEASISSTILNEGHWDYKWVSQSHSVLNYPDNWRHPVELLLQYKRDKIYEQYGFNTESTNGSKERGLQLKAVEKSKLKNCVYLSLPRSLPLNCSNSHLHKWKAEILDESNPDLVEEAVFVQGRIKVIFVNGCIYRFLWSSPRTLEVYPGDGTVMKSSGLSGNFFQHFVYRNGKVEERMYSVDAPPPQVPGMSYSIAQLTKRAARYLDLMQASGNLPPMPSCYSSAPTLAPKPAAQGMTMLEECVVQGLGKFTAHVSGRIRVVFRDRTALDMRADLSPRLDTCSKHSEEVEVPTMHQQLRPADIPEGCARLMLPNGHYQTVEIRNPGPHKRYIEAALDWVAWVNSMPDQRKEFYKDTVYDPQKAHDVQAELKKINCFNYIVENAVLPKVSSAEHFQPTGQPDMDNAILEDPFSYKPLPSQTLPTKYGHNGNFHSNNYDDGNGQYHPRNQLSRGYSGHGGGDGMNLGMVQDILNKTSKTLADLDQYLAVNGEVKPSKN